jgi:hypothetical protein
MGDMDITEVARHSGVPFSTLWFEEWERDRRGLRGRRGAEAVIRFSRPGP